MPHPRRQPPRPTTILVALLLSGLLPLSFPGPVSSNEPDGGDRGTRRKHLLMEFVQASSVRRREILAELERMRLPGRPHRPAAPPTTATPRPNRASPSTGEEFTPTTPHGTTPARKLTRRQALEELESLRTQGIIGYNKKWGRRVQVHFPVAGVAFRAKWRSHPTSKSYPIDPRLAVATVRLALWARSRGVTEITHLGFMGRSSTDRHGQGRAVDLAGFRGVDPRTGRSFDHDVLRDWGKAPKRRGQNYRLDPASPAGAFFADAYRFLTTEFRDRKPGPSSIGQRTYIISPDHPSSSLARTHKDHFHVEVPPGR